MQISAADSTMVPALLLLRQMGYTVSIDQARAEVSAEKEGSRFTGGDPLAVLGLIKLIEVRGENWRATEAEIEALLNDFNS